jgi:hypothetical protein
MKHRGKQGWLVLLTTEFVGTSTHCDNFDRDAVWDGWRLTRVLVPESDWRCR